MILEINLTIGGLGLFLFGMSAMTHGLKSLADDRMRELLAKSTKSPFSGVLTGMTTTAIVQSSSATTVAAVGFVGAGLLTFPAALGVIFGANIGTTLKGWFVALLGFKFQLGQVLMPAILVGALMGLSSKRRLSAVGNALTGFGLIFVGIDFLQQGIGGLGELVTPETFPPPTFVGRIELVLIGLTITVLTQSSSAGVAMALTSVHAGVISLEQAAAMVIGMDLGTTVTAALATVGGNVQARRTGFAHVIYNSMTAIAAFCLLSPFFFCIEKFLPGASGSDPELVLVGFHTFFNTFGVFAVLPFTNSFAQLIIKIFPEVGNPFTTRLEKSLLATPELALQAVSGTLQELVHRIYSELSDLLNSKLTGTSNLQTTQIEDAFQQTQLYLPEIQLAAENTNQTQSYLSALHVLDHLQRVFRRLGQEQKISRLREDPKLIELVSQLQEMVATLDREVIQFEPEELGNIRNWNRQIKSSEKSYRKQIVRQVASRVITSTQAIERMDSARWIRRLGYHTWRIAYHLRTEPTLEQASETASTESDTNTTHSD